MVAGPQDWTHLYWGSALALRTHSSYLSLGRITAQCKTVPGILRSMDHSEEEQESHQLMTGPTCIDRTSYSACSLVLSIMAQSIYYITLPSHCPPSRKYPERYSCLLNLWYNQAIPTGFPFHFWLETKAGGAYPLYSMHLGGLLMPTPLSVGQDLVI